MSDTQAERSEKIFIAPTVNGGLHEKPASSWLAASIPSSTHHPGQLLH